VVEKPDLSVVIVNWNARELLADCLDSLFAAAERLTLEVLVVDNASSDGSVEMLQKSYPEVELIANRENLGFARAANQAIRRSRGCRILLLNPDTLVMKQSLSKMVGLLDLQPLVGALGPKILTAEGSIDSQAGRRFPTLLTELFDQLSVSRLFPRSRLFGRYLMGYWDHDDSREVDLLSGACLMVRREVIEQVGLLDKEFFLYGEDVEWCHRIQRAGWKVFYYAEAEIIHLGGGSTKGAKEGLPLEALRSMNLFFAKAYGALYARLHRCLIFLVTLAKEVFFLTKYLVGRDGRDRRNATQKMRLHYQVLRWSIGIADGGVARGPLK
jgi:GT2 family glycosyltransferase